MSKEDLSHNQLERLSFIDFRLYFTAEIRRNDLMDRFGISEAAATRDLTLYRYYVPKNIIYDTTLKSYRISENYARYFIKDTQAKDLLLALVHGIGDDLTSADTTSLVPCVLPSRLYVPQIEIFAAVSRAIYNKKPLKINYFSQSSGSTERVIVPLSFAGNGLRWHVRSYDRKREGFRDFVINRITKPKVLFNEKITDNETLDKDKDWKQTVELELAPHPNIKNKEYLELEYQMEGGVAKHKIRAAMAAYILRLWNVDCSDNPKASTDMHHLYLKNLKEVKKIIDLSIAPGC